MQSRKQILQKMKVFYDEVKNEIKNKTMRVQVDNEFQQVKIKDLNDENNFKMFTTSIREGKGFTAEQKIREFKTRIFEITSLEIKNFSNKYKQCKN